MKIGVIYSDDVYVGNLIKILSGQFDVITFRNDAITPCDIYLTTTTPIPAQLASIGAAPLYLIVTKNPTFDDMESFLYNRSVKIKYAGALLVENNAQYKTYLELTLNTEVHILPQLIGELPVLAPMQARTGKISIVLFDTNMSFNTSSWKQLIICEQFYKIHRGALECVYLFNIDDSNKTTIGMIESLTIFKEKRLRFFKNIAAPDILKFFSEIKGHAVFLTNQIYDDVNPFVYDILRAGLPLVHSSPSLNGHGLGVYYDKLDITAAAERVFKEAVTDYDAAGNIKRADELCKKYKGDAECFRNIILGLNPIDCARGPTLDIVNLLEPLVISFDNQPTADTAYYRHTLENNSWQYMIVGGGMKWDGCRTRMNAYKTVLGALPANKVVVLTHARDVFCLRGANKFLDAYKSYGKSIVASMELMCDGAFETTDRDAHTQCQPLTQYWSRVGAIPDRRFVNNGLVCGTVAALRDFLAWALDNKYTDDQFAMGNYMNTFPDRVAADCDARLLHTSVFGVNAGLQCAPKQSADSPTFAELFGRGAFFLHLSDKRYAGVGVVYDFVKAVLEKGASDALLRKSYKWPEPEFLTVK
jgi:hypothetical protein